VARGQSKIKLRDRRTACILVRLGGYHRANGNYRTTTIGKGVICLLYVLNRLDYFPQAFGQHCCVWGIFLFWARGKSWNEGLSRLFWWCALFVWAQYAIVSLKGLGPFALPDQMMCSTHNHYRHDCLSYIRVRYYRNRENHHSQRELVCFLWPNRSGIGLNPIWSKNIRQGCQQIFLWERQCVYCGRCHFYGLVRLF